MLNSRYFSVAVRFTQGADPVMQRPVFETMLTISCVYGGIQYGDDAFLRPNT